ncbi:hypothetical protein GGF31_000082 [Allomyces arbusculus]|nr:hypothetical protein GGF31_000082 [Allomyces arbusculus]
MTDLPLLLGALSQNGLQKFVLHVVISDDDCLRSISDLDDIHMANVEIPNLEVALHGHMAHMVAFVLLVLLEAFPLSTRSFTLTLPPQFSWAEVEIDQICLSPSLTLRHLDVVHQNAEFPIDWFVAQLPATLESLHLSGCYRTPALATLAAHLPRTLRELNLDRNGLDALSLSPLLLQNCPSLCTLDLSHNKLASVHVALRARAPEPAVECRSQVDGVDLA